MEFSEDTMTILRNFSGINQNIIIKQGNVLKTVSEAKNILASATISEEIPQDFGIYDLSEFIGVLSLVDTPNLNFETKDYVMISDSSGRSKIKYFFSSEETLTAPSKDITMPECEVKFQLDNDVLNKLKKACSTLGHNEVSITNENNIIKLSVVDPQNSTSNVFSIDVDGEYPEGSTFNFMLNINNLKIIPGNYDVEISSKLISQFSNPESNVKYWIAVEKSSTFSS
tara:strand:+ start:119 stop:799 length:681 start_codon:yes stop_codon:yes gene_type:complete